MMDLPPQVHADAIAMIGERKLAAEQKIMHAANNISGQMMLEIYADGYRQALFDNNLLPKE